MGLLYHKAVGVCREFKVQGRYETRHKEEGDMLREKNEQIWYITQVTIFFSNASTCPLWTSWPSLLGMAGV